MTIQSQLQNRTGIKYNQMRINETGKIDICKDDYNGQEFSLDYVRSKLMEGSFENIVIVFLYGELGISGPNVKPSRKSLNRLMKIINGTNYRIIQQSGQTFTIEGLN
jgi:hypothetical protein